MEQQQDYKYIRGPRCPEPSNEEAVYWQLPVHHPSYPRQTRQLHAETIGGTDPTQQTTSQQQNLRWQPNGEPWGSADSTEHRRNVPKGGKPVKHIPGYGGSKGKSWHSYGGSKGKSWTQTCNQGWEWSSGAEKSSEANYSAGWRATAVEPWNQAPARASHAKQMSESQTCTKADAKGTRRQVVQWPGNPDCGDESSSAEETVVQMEQEVADVWQ